MTDLKEGAIVAALLWAAWLGVSLMSFLVTK